MQKIDKNYRLNKPLIGIFEFLLWKYEKKILNLHSIGAVKYCFP